MSSAVSIVIPAYNCEKFLMRSVESALHQDYIDIEVIVIDDGSSDKTLSIAEKFAARDSRIKVVAQPNSGVSAARNRGIEEASGEYLLFLDADDVLLPDAISILLKIIKEYDAEIAAGNYIEVSDGDADSWNDGIEQNDNKGNEKIMEYEPESFVEEVLYQSGQPSHSPWAKLYRKELFSDIKFPEGVIYEDLDQIPLALLKANKIVQTDRVCYLYVRQPHSITHTFTPGRADVLDVVDRLYHKMAGISERLGRAAADRKLSANFNMYCLCASRDKMHETPQDALKYQEIMSRARGNILELRRSCLFNPKVRLRNKIGILSTYIGGFSLLRILAKILY
ncbi:MAG: glycosyltransferase [Prevotella sp.]|nr:glycosyltransferase [Bacteroides sp.]MCM1366669.1 glycosyltransferase [Prevotella sp.]MCM1437336.1 glycosyltransferase [Prevotella sp.]